MPTTSARSWARQIRDYQYPPGYRGRCMYCVECGNEDHSGHKFVAERDLEASLDAAQYRDPEPTPSSSPPTPVAPDVDDVWEWHRRRIAAQTARMHPAMRGVMGDYR